MPKRVTTFLLQVLQFEVDALNCLVVKPHRLLTRKGRDLNSDELQELYDGLKLNKVNQYDCMLPVTRKACSSCPWWWASCRAEAAELQGLCAHETLRWTQVELEKVHTTVAISFLFT